MQCIQTQYSAYKNNLKYNIFFINSLEVKTIQCHTLSTHTNEAPWKTEEWVKNK